MGLQDGVQHQMGSLETGFSKLRQLTNQLTERLVVNSKAC